MSDFFLDAGILHVFHLGDPVARGLVLEAGRARVDHAALLQHEVGVEVEEVFPFDVFVLERSELVQQTEGGREHVSAFLVEVQRAVDLSVDHDACIHAGAHTDLSEVLDTVVRVYLAELVQLSQCLRIHVQVKVNDALGNA